MGKEKTIAKPLSQNKSLFKRFNMLTDTNKLLTITIIVFVVMYICAVIFEGKGFLSPQALFNILINNAALLITACGMS